MPSGLRDFEIGLREIVAGKQQRLADQPRYGVCQAVAEVQLGLDNIYGRQADRYPRIGLAELRESGAGLVILPDEPYQFSADDGPEAFPGIPAALVSGRHLTWYGPSLAEAPAVLRGQLGC